MPETRCQMVIDHPGRLHERVHYGRADEVETAFFQVLADRVRELGFCRYLGRGLQTVVHWPAVDETPNVLIE